MIRKSGGLRPTIKVKGLTTGSGGGDSNVTVVNETPIPVEITEPLITQPQAVYSEEPDLSLLDSYFLRINSKGELLVYTVNSAGGSDVDGASFTINTDKGQLVMGIDPNNIKKAIKLTTERSIKVSNQIANILMNSNYKSPIDFTANYSSISSLTITGMEISESFGILGEIVIIRANYSTVVIRRGENGISYSVSGNVLSVIGASPFLNTDISYIIGFQAQDKAYDASTNSILTSPIKNVWNQYSDIEPLVTAQNLTASYVDFGAEIDMQGFNVLGIWIISDVNDSRDVNIKALVKHTSDSIDEFEIDGISTKQLWGSNGSDNKKYYEFNVGAVPIVQLQAMAGTVGTTPGDLTISITKRYIGGTE